MSALQRALIAGALLGCATLASAQSAYPTKPIHMVVPLAAGSAVDNAMRIVTQRMAENLGQGIVIDNQPGRPVSSARSGSPNRPPTATPSADSTTAS